MTISYDLTDQEKARVGYDAAAVIHRSGSSW